MCSFETKLAGSQLGAENTLDGKLPLVAVVSKMNCIKIKRVSHGVRVFFYKKRGAGSFLQSVKCSVETKLNCLKLPGLTLLMTVT